MGKLKIKLKLAMQVFGGLCRSPKNSQTWASEFVLSSFHMIYAGKANVFIIRVD